MAIKCHHLNDLTDCVLLKIFKHLPSKVDIWRARNVCTRWYNLLVDGELWRVSNLSNFKFDDISLLEKIQRSISLEVLVYLEIHNKMITMDVLSVILKTANQMRGLRLNGCTVRSGRSINSCAIIKPGSSKVAYITTALHRLKLKYLDLRYSRGNFGFMETLLPLSCSKINVLGLSNSFQTNFQTIRNQPFLFYLQNLQMLECTDCTWVNDATLAAIAQYCPHLQSLNASNCLNIQGSTLHKVLTKCKNLKTLILRKTSVREEDLVHPPTWSNLKITELDISCCYRMDEGSVNKIVGGLAGQLQYLCCAVNDELIANITEIKKPLKLLELRRMHDVDMTAIVNFLSTCECIEVLDISSVPVDYELFKVLLPNLPNLRWFSIAGHEVGKSTFELISQHNSNIEEIAVNFYQAPCNDVGALKELISSCPKLRKICIQGSYVKDILQDLISEVKNDPRIGQRSVDFCKATDFEFPSARHSIDRFAEKFACNTLACNFNRGNQGEGNLLI